MLTEKKELGNAGEREAGEYLEGNGWRILAWQARIPRVGEIDLIAQDPETREIVFIEVKTRRDARYGTPEEAVTASKLRRIFLLAEAWLASRGLSERAWRVDVIAVDRSGPRTEIRHLRAVT